MINISNLTNRKNNQNYIFADLHLDLMSTLTSNSKKSSILVSGNDIVIDVDQQAILNSIVNLLTQSRYLNPDINTNLKKLIGQPITSMNAQSIGESINRIINLYELRVTINQILVAPDPDNNLYTILLYLILPNFSNKNIILNLAVDNQGNFSFINK